MGRRVCTWHKPSPAVLAKTQWSAQRRWTPAGYSLNKSQIDIFLHFSLRNNTIMYEALSLHAPHLLVACHPRWLPAKIRTTISGTWNLILKLQKLWHLKIRNLRSKNTTGLHLLDQLKHHRRNYFGGQSARKENQMYFFSGQNLDPTFKLDNNSNQLLLVSISKSS